MTALATAPPTADPDAPQVDFDTAPEHYRHWRLVVDGPTAWVYLDVAEDGGLVEGYELKLNSYDLGVDIELYDLTQRLRFTHPQVRSVVLTSGKDSNFCAGANIRMLAGSSHPWKVNFCKFTNETRNGIEAMTAAGQTWIAALNGTAAGGGYEMALACERILLVDDRSSAVSLPEVPLLGVLPGTGGLTRVVDKRHVRKDRADVFATRPEGFGGRKAVAWRLVDEAVPRREWDETVRARAAEAAAASTRPDDAVGVDLPPLRREATADGLRYDHVRVDIDRDARTATLTVEVPEGVTDDPAVLHDEGAAHWLLAVTRELDDAILRLRTNELEIGTWLVRTEGSVGSALAADRMLREHAGDWLVDETRHYLERTLKRLDVTSRSLIALVEPGSAFAGPLVELALACDRQYMLEGVFEDADDADSQEPATLTLTESAFGLFPMGNGLSRLASRFWGDDPALDAVRRRLGDALTGAEAEEIGLVTDAPDDIDWADEIRILLEERAALSPDALTGMEANHRFVGPETMETRIFGRLTAWQNWIFVRPNASGPEGALRKYGTGRKADFDTRRV